MKKGFKEPLHFLTKDSKTFLMEEVRPDGSFRRSKDLNVLRGMWVHGIREAPKNRCDVGDVICS